MKVKGRKAANLADSHEFFSNPLRASAYQVQTISRICPVTTGTASALALVGSLTKGTLMKMKNEALRMFLAVTALILTAILTSPAAEQTTDKAPVAKVAKASTVKAKGESSRVAQFKSRRSSN